MSKGKIKSSIASLEEYLKKNASIGAEISVILKDGNVFLGKVIKSGDKQFFIPPEVDRKSEYIVDVPACCKFTLSKDKNELTGVQLDGFDEIIVNLKNHWENKRKVEEQPEVK